MCDDFVCLQMCAQQGTLGQCVGGVCECMGGSSGNGFGGFGFGGFGFVGSGP
jgi:hypothetical protein